MITISAFLVALILSFIMNKVYYNNWDNYSEVSRQIKMLNGEKADFINLGSSHGQEDLKYSNNEGINLAFPNQTFYFDYRLLKKYYNHLDENGIVIIPISLFSFYAGNKMLEETNGNYFGLLKPSENYNTKPSDVMFSGTQKFFTTKFYTNIIKESQSHESSSNQPINIEDWQLESVKTAKTQLGEIGKFSRDPEDLSMESFIEILSFAKEKQLKVVLITTPKTELYIYNINRINPNAYEERIYTHISNCEQIIGRDIPFLDYSHDDLFINNYDYFRDDDHLNEKGAELFTAILLQDLKNDL